MKRLILSSTEAVNNITKSELSDRLYSAFMRTQLYNDAVQAFNTNNKDGANIVRKIWEDDVNYAPDMRNWSYSMSTRYVSIKLDYGVDDKALLEDLWYAARAVTLRWEELEKVQKLLRSSSWYMKRATKANDYEAAQLWKTTHDEISDCLQQMWAQVELGNKNIKILREAEHLHRDAKAATQLA